MRRALVIVAWLAAATGLASANPHDLAGGALIAHNAGLFNVRYHWPDCRTYFQHNPITNCDEQNTTMETGQYAWFVIAAFAEDKQWCGVEFGFDDYDPMIMYFMECEPCYPSDGLEISSPDWPGPMEGTSFVTTDTPWSGNWLPVYWFHVYVYSGYGAGVVQLIPDPTVPDPLGGFGNCLTPPQMWDAALGGMGVNEPGVEVCWSSVGTVCCVGTDCMIVSGEEECASMGGALHPEWDNCGPPNPCGVTPAATMSWGRLKDLYR